MRDLPLEEHVIMIARLLKVREMDVMQCLFDTFENTSCENSELLNDAYEFFASAVD